MPTIKDSFVKWSYKTIGLYWESEGNEHHDPVQLGENGSVGKEREG